MENSRYLGYERSNTIPINCEECKKVGLCIEDILSSKQQRTELLSKYLTKLIDLECLSANNNCCSADTIKIAGAVGQALLSSSLSELIDILKVADKREPVTTDNIPQYGDLSIAMYLIPDILTKSEHLGYIELGKMIFYKEGKKNEAYRKYAENHCKLAALLDLAVIKKKPPSGYEITSSVMGRYFSLLPIEKKDELLPRLCLRIPIIQEALISQDYRRSVNSSLSILSESTRMRRKTGIMNLIAFTIDA